MDAPTVEIAEILKSSPNLLDACKEAVAQMSEDAHEDERVAARLEQLRDAIDTATRLI